MVEISKDNGSYIKLLWPGICMMFGKYLYQQLGYFRLAEGMIKSDCRKIILLPEISVTIQKDFGVVMETKVPQPTKRNRTYLLRNDFLKHCYDTISHEWCGIKLLNKEIEKAAEFIITCLMY